MRFYFGINTNYYIYLNLLLITNAVVRFWWCSVAENSHNGHIASEYFFFILQLFVCLQLRVIYVDNKFIYQYMSAFMWVYVRPMIPVAHKSHLLSETVKSTFALNMLMYIYAHIMRSRNCFNTVDLLSCSWNEGNSAWSNVTCALNYYYP